jgi:hypothetical protein
MVLPAGGIGLQVNRNTSGDLVVSEIVDGSPASRTVPDPWHAVRILLRETRRDTSEGACAYVEHNRSMKRSVLLPPGLSCGSATLLGPLLEAHNTSVTSCFSLRSQ